MRRTQKIYEESSVEQPKSRSKPSMFSEEREKECIGLAYSLVEKRLREGTATSQETVHFLKLGSMQARLEQEKLLADIEKKRAEVDSIVSAQRTEELIEEAMKAFKSYSPNYDEEEEGY